MKTELIRKRYALLAPLLDERHLRLYVGAEALALGYGGTALVPQATGGFPPHQHGWLLKNSWQRGRADPCRLLLAAYANLVEGASARSKLMRRFAPTWRVS